MATGFQWSSSDYFSPLSAPQVNNYGPYFPGGKTCSVGPCIEYARASVYIFTTEKSPNAVPLVPLYRMSFEGTFPGGPSNPNSRDHTYTTEAAGIKTFAGVGYRLDGIEGYIYKRCTPEPSCIPAGAVRLYRYYNATRDDWAILPESELSTWTANGYAAQSGTNPWIGYVYPNVDTDGDGVIDSFENLIGTNPNAADSDCDGKSDGDELLKYPMTDPKVGSC
jgi:serine protease